MLATQNGLTNYSSATFESWFSCCQIVVLARVIEGWNQVDLTAHGVSILVDILRSREDHVIILTGASKQVSQIRN